MEGGRQGAGGKRGNVIEGDTDYDKHAPGETLGAGASESKSSSGEDDVDGAGSASASAGTSPPEFRDATVEQRKLRRTAALAIRTFMAVDSVYHEALQAKHRVATTAFLSFAASTRVASGNDAIDAMAAHSGSGLRLRWLRPAAAALAKAQADAAAAAATSTGGGGTRRGSAKKPSPALSFDDMPAGIVSSRAQGVLLVERGGCAAGSSPTESLRVLQTRGLADSRELLAQVQPSTDEHGDPVVPAESLVALAVVAPHVASRLLQAWSGMVRARVMAPALDLEEQYMR